MWFVLLGWCVSAHAQQTVSDTVRQQRTIRLHNGTEVTETHTTVVTEEAPSKKKKNKVKVRKPKNMEYRLTLLEVEFEVEKQRKSLRTADGEARKELLQQLIDTVARIKNVKQADYDEGYTQVIVWLPDDTEYRVAL